MVVRARIANLDLGKEIAQLLGQTQSPRKMGNAILHPNGNGLKRIKRLNKIELDVKVLRKIRIEIVVLVSLLK